MKNSTLKAPAHLRSAPFPPSGNPASTGSPRWRWRPSNCCRLWLRSKTYSPPDGRVC